MAGGHPFDTKGGEVYLKVKEGIQGRKCAVQVHPLKGYRKNNRELKQKTFSIILFCSFAYVLFVLLNSNSIPLELVGLYTVMSVIAFIIYAKDKNAAEYGKWRTSENTLHTLSLFGGWPGAAIAQSFLRHKSKKISFRVTYWITVIANCGALYWLITPAGSLWLRNIIKEITILIKKINI